MDWARQVKKRLEKRLHLVYRIADFVLRIRTSAKSVVDEVDSCPFGFAQGRLSAGMTRQYHL
jgi:hypothetical protein